MGWREDAREWQTRYFRGAVGLTIVDFKWRDTIEDEDDPDGESYELDDPFPVLICRDADGELVELDISRDAEGNGPGMIFGLPLPDKEA